MNRITLLIKKNVRLLLPVSTIFLLLAGCGGGGGDDGDGTSAAPAKLSAPSGIAAKVTATATMHEVTLSWDAVPGADSYNLYYAQEPIIDIGNYAALNGGMLKQDITGTSVTLTETSLAIPSDYYFRLTTDNSAYAEGAASDQVHAFVAVGGINDTGITRCGDYAYPVKTPPTDSNHEICANVGATQTADGSDGDGDLVPAGQDALYGRDANVATNRDIDGPVGFSYSKLSSVDGSQLTIQTRNWSAAGSEANGTHWGCVRDNVTGLIWEVKQSDANSPRYFLHRYTWFNNDTNTSGGSAGDPGSATSCYIPSGEGPAMCNTQAYAAYVNSIELCGFNDWRMPTVNELLGLINYSTSPAANVNFLGSVSSALHWSALPAVSTLATNFSWGVYFDFGQVSIAMKDGAYPVRLVRDAQ